MAKGDRNMLRYLSLSKRRKSVRRRLRRARMARGRNESKNIKDISFSALIIDDKFSFDIPPFSIPVKDVEEAGSSYLPNEDNCEYSTFNDADNFNKSQDIQDTLISALSITEKSSYDIPNCIKSNQSFFPSGRRIIDVEYWFRTLQNHKHDPLINCSFTDMEIINEIKKGFFSTFSLKCKICKSELQLHSEDPHKANLNVNLAAVSAIVLAGGGYSQLQEISDVLNIPHMSNDMFLKCQTELSEKFVGNFTKEAGGEEADSSALTCSTVQNGLNKVKKETISEEMFIKEEAIDSDSQDNTKITK